MIKINYTKPIIDKKSLTILRRNIVKYAGARKKIHKEKIAFSLFCMYNYNFDFKFEKDDYLINLRIKELKDLWELGKSKDKLQFFFNLAEKFDKVKFDN